ncbi:MAG: hypothetical protein QXR16_01210 [Candidatus Micrarchaeaceae archaeon]
MKLQTSLEFLLILGAIGTLAVSAIALYSNKVHYAQKLFGSALSGNSPLNFSVPAMHSTGVYVTLYMPLNTTLYQQSQLYVAVYGCANGSAEFHLASNSLAFASSNLYDAFNGIGMLSTEFEPIKPGTDTASINYSVSCGSYTEANAARLSTFSTESTQNSQISARISNRRERIIYPFEDKMSMFALSEWSHCTYTDFWGNPLPTSIQCGANAWDYRIFSDYCYTRDSVQTVTFCIAPYPTGINLSTAGVSEEKYAYSFTLYLYAFDNLLLANLSNASRTSNVLLGKSTVGNATILNVSGNSAFSSVEVLSKGNYSWVANASAYEWYTQAKNNLYSTLSYYNNSGVSQSTQAQIQQIISAYSEAYSNLVKSEPYNLTGCSFSGYQMSCNAIEPFSYYINANIQGLAANSTTSYMGSIVTIA